MITKRKKSQPQAGYKVVKTYVRYTAFNTKTKKYHVGTDATKGNLKPIWSSKLPSFFNYLAISEKEALSMFKDWPEVIAVKITTEVQTTVKAEI